MEVDVITPLFHRHPYSPLLLNSERPCLLSRRCLLGCRVILFCRGTSPLDIVINIRGLCTLEDGKQLRLDLEQQGFIIANTTSVHP